MFSISKLSFISRVGKAELSASLIQSIIYSNMLICCSRNISYYHKCWNSLFYIIV